MATEGASIGDVYVEISPRAVDFWAKFRAQTGGEATKLGDDLGKQIGGRIADAIGRGVRDGIDQGTRGAPGREAGRKTGEDFSGEFDRVVRTRITAALRALPKAEIGAAATAAEQKIRDLRAQLQELSGRRIGIDIDEATALAEIRRIQEELARLARESPSIQITADAARATAELEAVRAEAERVSRLNPRIQVDTDAGRAATELLAVDAAAQRSSSGIGNLIAAGVALGPAIIPAALAAAAAIAGIGAGAAGVAAGLGVAILGTRGIGAAVTAMGAAEADAGKRAQGLAGSQFQVASAADAVRSAEAGLANARANAAEASRRAAETTANAQIALGQAEQQAARAERDLTVAREDARRAMEDLNLQVADGALAQRAALLSVERAKQQLDATLANPASTQLQRKEAQLSYDQAVQQVTDLGVRQQRLVVDQAAAQKAGIDGSKQVTSAQQQVTQAQDGVRKAVQALGDARIAEGNTARQNAYSVAQAVQAVESAQRSMGHAAVGAGTAGSASLDKLRASMAALTPEGQRFAAFLFGLRGTLNSLSATAQRGLLPGVQEGITGLLPLLPAVNRLVGDVATTLGRLAAEAGHAFGGPYWRDFIGFIDSQATPALTTLARSSYNVALGLSGLVRAFAPLGADLGGGLLRFTQDFARWSITLGSNQAFQQFLAYVRVEGPIVAHTVLDVVQAAIRLVQAVEPIGGVSLTAIRAFAGVINALPIPVLTVVAGSIVAVVAAMKLWDFWQTVVKLSATPLAAAQLLLGQTLLGARTAMAATGPEAGRLATALAGIRGGASAAGGGVASLAGSLGAGGVLGLAIAGVALLALPLISMFQAQAKAAADVKAKTDALSGSLRDLAGHYGDAARSSEEHLRELIKSDPKFRDFVLNANQVGISVGTISAALHGNKGALDQVNTAYNNEIGTLQQYLNWKRKEGSDVERTAQEWAAYQEIVKRHPELLNKSTDEIQNYINTIKSQRDSTNDVATALLAEGRALGLVDGAAGSLDGSSQRLTTGQQALSDALVVLHDKTASASDKIDALKRAEDALNGAAIAVADAQRELAAAAIAVTTSLQQNRGATDDYTTAGHANIDALKGQVLASVDVYNATLAATGSVEQATTARDAAIAKIYAEIDASGLSRAEKDALKAKTRELIDVYGQIPGSKVTDVSVTGVDGVKSQLDALAILQRALKFGEDLQTATNEYLTEKRINANFGHLAAGGPVVGPGGPTDDLVPTWLSAGEYVIPARVVGSLGQGFFDQMIGRGPAGGFGFAAGGPVPAAGHAFSGSWPYPTTAAHTRIPSQSEVRAAVTPVWRGSSNVGQWSSIATAVLAELRQPLTSLGALLRRIDFESGGNPTIVNTTDSNWQAGTPSVGLAQVISGTFASYAGKYRNTGPFLYGVSTDGHANIFAGMNYATHRYGSVAAIDPNIMHSGYDSGGILPPGVTIATNTTGRNEFVLTSDQVGQLRGSDGASITIHVHGADHQSPQEIAAAVRHELAWEMRGN